eukprot:980271_1
MPRAKDMRPESTQSTISTAVVSVRPASQVREKVRGAHRGGLADRGRESGGLVEQGRECIYVPANAKAECPPPSQPRRRGGSGPSMKTDRRRNPCNTAPNPERDHCR